MGSKIYELKKNKNIKLVREHIEQFTREEKPYKALNIGKDRKRELDFNTIKDFKDVEIGDIALDYNNYNNDNNNVVLAKGIGIDSFLKYGRKYDESGAMQSFFDEVMENIDDGYDIDDVKWIAINYIEDTAVWIYEFDGGWVPKYMN